MFQQPSVRKLRIVNTRGPFVLRHQPILGDQYGAAGDFGQGTSDQAVAQTTSRHERTAMKIKQSTVGMGVRRQHPLAGATCCIWQAMICRPESGESTGDSKNPSSIAMRARWSRASGWSRRSSLCAWRIIVAHCSACGLETLASARHTDRRRLPCSALQVK